MTVPPNRRRGRVLALPVLIFASVIVVAAPKNRPATTPEAQETARPLPDQDAFLQEARKHLKSDSLLRSQYTYLEKQTQIRLGAKGEITKKVVRVYEVYPPLGEKDEPYRRLISIDGVPVKASELAKRDRERQNEVLEHFRKLEHEGISARQERLRNEAEQQRKDQENIDEVFRLYDFQMVGRETVDGHSAIAFTFTPRPNFKARTNWAKILRQFRGRAWLSEDDYELIRVEAEAIDDITIGWGLVARLHKGSAAVFQRRQVNNEIWLPAEAHFVGSGRILLLKKFRIDAISEFSDYKKFTVDSSTTFTLPKPPP